jgi:predicted TIM-barrel fold metal-dependent hydrolase
VCPFCDTPGPNPSVHSALHDACLRFPGRLIPFARLDPRYGQKAIDALKQSVEAYGFRGLLFNPVSSDSLPYQPGVLPLMEYAAENNLPVLVSSGQAYVALPEQIGLLAAKIPSLRVVIGHMGTAAHAVRAISLLKSYPNIYLETSLQQSPYRIALLSPYILAGRVMFGSAATYSNIDVELLKLRVAGLPDDQLERLLSLNARYFFGLGEEGRP